MSYHLQRGQLLLSQKRYKEAEKELKQVLASEPDNPLAFAMLAECCLDTKRYSEGLEFAQKAISVAPHHPLLFYVLARAYFYNKKTKEARQAIQQGQQLAPNEADFFFLLANIEFYEEKWQAALSAAEQGLNLDPEDVNLINLRAQALIKLNRQEEAASTLDFALNRAPEDAYSHANKGWVAIEQDKYEDAINHFKEALRLNPESHFAKTGLKEAIKAKNYLYRYILKYFLWMSKMNERGRWGFIIGVYIIYRILLGVAETNPGVAPFLYPLIFAYIVFAFSSWIALPVSNLFLRLHPLGKYALDEDEILGSNIVGILGISALISLAIFYVTGMEVLLYLGGFLAIMLIPVGGLFGVSLKSKARKYLTYYTLILALLGMAALFTSASSLPVLLFFLGIFAYGWVANYLIGKEAKEF